MVYINYEQTSNVITLKILKGLCVNFLRMIVQKEIIMYNN